MLKSKQQKGLFIHHLAGGEEEEQGSFLFLDRRGVYFWPLGVVFWQGLLSRWRQEKLHPLELLALQIV